MKEKRIVGSIAQWCLIPFKTEKFLLIVGRMLIHFL